MADLKGAVAKLLTSALARWRGLNDGQEQVDPQNGTAPQLAANDTATGEAMLGPAGQDVQTPDQELYYAAGLPSKGRFSVRPYWMNLDPRVLNNSDSTVGVCSTWGFGHFHTFDNFMYDFSGTCNYILASDCRSLTPAFNVQMRRDALGSIQRIVIELPSSTVRVSREGITLDGRNIPLPFFSEGVLIRTFGILVRLEVKPINLTVMWNREDYLTVEVGENFQNRTCGLCGDFNGDPLKSEFEGNLIPFQFANEQQEDDPNEACLPLESSCSSGIICIEYAYLCKELLDKVALHCPVDKELYVIRCQQDLCLGPEKGQVQSSCSTLTEYARVCARIAPETVSRWRTASLCTVGHCPESQVYLETGSPCRQTCSSPRFRCPAVYNPGCFCPNGTVLDNISEKSRCVRLEECPCVNNGHKYQAGQRRESRCESCVCLNSRWECKERFCPSTCAVEGGSHVTSFDSHKYRFHGSCTYVLLKSALLPWGGMVMGHFHKCGTGERQSCLTAVSFASTQVTFSLDRHGVHVENQNVQHLPLRTEHFVIFNQSSSFLQVDMWPWLTLQLQLQPVLSVYLRAEKKLFGLTKGLCGNFNDNSRDDFKNSMGIREGIASRFVHSWRLRSRCASPRNTDLDPCRWSEASDGSLLQRPSPAAEYASTHCRALLNKSSVFGQCHGEVNPLSYFKRCLYEVCNYEETQDYLCGALQSYSRACAEKGMVLKNWWNETAHCAVTCPQNQEFMQNGSLCGRTCRSLSPGATCSPSPVPLEGCSCPPGTYLDQLGSCVPPASCPCFEDNRYFPAGSAVQLDGLTCLCSYGVLDCEGSRGLLLQGEEQDDLSSLCTPPKIFHSCVNETQKACEPTCQDLRIGAICMTCESECFCPNGQYEDELLGCVAPEDCSCQQGETFYQANTVLQTECQSCTCRAGRWDCVMRSVCPGTCVQYGEGHFRTFDDRRFVFDGSCAYTLLQDTCDGADQGRFSLESKVVLCETLGPTCSRAVRLTVGDVSIELAGETYTVTPPSASANFTIHDNSLYLVVTATIPYSNNKLVLIWNRNMNVIVKLMKSTQMSLCGLCGNFNGKASDDFRLRSGDLTSDAVAFANSWRTDPSCPLVQEQPSPCDTNPQRRAWAHRKCDIIRSPVFEPCHAQVYYLPFYDACVRDACGCALGGDCKCVCNAVAMYAKECLDQGVCVDWRRPDFCPVYCEFYNSHQLAGASYHYTGNGSCSWHYQPCLCPFQTQGLSSTQNLEGCYSCPTDQYFSVDLQQCAACGIVATPAPTAATGLQKPHLLLATRPWSTGPATVQALTATAPPAPSAALQPSQAPSTSATLSHPAAAMRVTPPQEEWDLAGTREPTAARATPPRLTGPAAAGGTATLTAPESETCRLVYTNQTISMANCTATVAVGLCQGSCSSASWLALLEGAPTLSVLQSCRCCAPVEGGRTPLELQCQEGGTAPLSVPVPRACACTERTCT